MKATTKMTNAFSKTYNVFTNTEAFNILKDPRVLKMMGYNSGMNGFSMDMNLINSFSKRVGQSQHKTLLAELSEYLKVLNYKPIYILLIY